MRKAGARCCLYYYYLCIPLFYVKQNERNLYSASSKSRTFAFSTLAHGELTFIRLKAEYKLLRICVRRVVVRRSSIFVAVPCFRRGRRVPGTQQAERGFIRRTVFSFLRLHAVPIFPCAIFHGRAFAVLSGHLYRYRHVSLLFSWFVEPGVRCIKCVCEMTT